MALYHREVQRRAGPGDRRGAVRGGVQRDGEPAARVQRLRRGARAGRQRAARHRAAQRLPLPRRRGAGRRQRRQHLQAADDRPSAATTWAGDPTWRATPAAWRAWPRSTPPSAPGRSTRSVDEVLAALGAARVPAGRVYTAKDIAEDPHYRARDMILRQPTRDGHELDVPGIVPKLSATPGAAAHARAASGRRHRCGAARDGARRGSRSPRCGNGASSAEHAARSSQAPTIRTNADRLS